VSAQIVSEKKIKNFPLQMTNLFCRYKYLREPILIRATKILLYKSPIRPIVAYGAETWTVKKKGEQALLIFEKKIFRSIYGMVLNVKIENGKVGRIEN
jgi:hypothetical protein